MSGDVKECRGSRNSTLQGNLANLDSEEIDKANNLVLEKILRSNLRLETIEPARKVIQRIRDDTFLHAGPPVSWPKMCGPMKGSMIGACIYEGLAEDPVEAEKVLESDKINFVSCNDCDAIAPMAGVVSPSMPIIVVRNKTYGSIAYSNLNEGLGRVLRFGAYENEVIKRLHWMEEKLAPALKISLEAVGGINLNTILSRALLMGDECHNRNVAGTALFARELFPSMIDNLTNNDTMVILKFLQGNNHFCLTLSKNPNYPIPHLNFSGIPIGVDVRSIIKTGILPIINTGIAHRIPGGGQIGECEEIFG